MPRPRTAEELAAIQAVDARFKELRKRHDYGTSLNMVTRLFKNHPINNSDFCVVRAWQTSDRQKLPDAGKIVEHDAQIAHTEATLKHADQIADEPIVVRG